MLAVVAAASAGTMSVWRTPNWANGASSAMASRPSPVTRANPRMDWSAVWPFASVDRSACHLVPHGHEQRSAWMAVGSCLMETVGGQEAAANGAHPAGSRGVCSDDRGRVCTDAAGRRMGSRSLTRGLAA